MMNNRNIDADEAVDRILTWVDEGNPEDDETNDLQDLYGETFDADTNINLPDEEDIDLNIEVVAEVPGGVNEENSQVGTAPVVAVPTCINDNENSDGEEEDYYEELPVVVNRPARKLLTAKRNVCSIDSALEETNYDPIAEPCDSKGGHSIERLTGYLGPRNATTTKKIYWTTTPNVAAGRQRACDILTGPHSQVRYGHDIENIYDCFMKLFNDEMLDRIVNCTNVRLDVFIASHAEKIARNTRYGWIRRTDKIEIKALLGLQYLRGLLGLNNHDHDILFSDQAGHPMFAATMGRNRFTLLISTLSFDTPEERQDKWRSDRFTAIRMIFECFNLNCLKHVVPSEYLSIDETLYPMRNQISMKQYNKDKPAKYGLLFKSINDARFPFTYQSQVYSGKPVDGDGPYYITGTENYVKALVENTSRRLSIKGRNISMDRLYTSISLANWLLGHNITMVGTFMSNRIGIPDQLKHPAGRENFSFSCHWEEEKKNLALCTYKVKTKSKGDKNVLMLSTMRPYFGKTKDDGKEKPQIYKFYDFTKGGTDIVDQKSAYYTTKSKSRKWKLVAFYYLMDTARINASTMLALKNGEDPKKQKSFEIGFELARSLIMPNIRRRRLTGLSKNIRSKISLVLGDEQPEEQAPANILPKMGDKRRNCKKCLDSIQGEGYNQKKQKLSSSKTQCQKCGNALCATHALFVCRDHVNV